MKTYTIRPDSQFLDTFMLHISKTKKIMHSDISRWAKNNAEPIDIDSCVAGLVHTMPVHEFAGDNNGWYNICFAHMFLNEERLSHLTISHECLHVAMAHERYITHFDMMYGGCYDSDIEAEERLAYYLGKSVDAVMEKLSNGGHWKNRKGK